MITLPRIAVAAGKLAAVAVSVSLAFLIIATCRNSGINHKESGCSEESAIWQRPFRLVTKPTRYDFGLFVVSGELPANMEEIDQLDLQTTDKPYVKLQSLQREGGRRCVEIKIDYFSCGETSCGAGEKGYLSTIYYMTSRSSKKPLPANQWTAFKHRLNSCGKMRGIGSDAIFRAWDKRTYVSCAVMSRCKRTHGYIDRLQRLCTNLRVKLVRRGSLP